MFATTSRESIGINWNLCYQEHLKQKLDEIGVKDLPPLHCLTIVKLRLGRPGLKRKTPVRRPAFKWRPVDIQKGDVPDREVCTGPGTPFETALGTNPKHSGSQSPNSNTPDHEKKTSALPRKRFTHFAKQGTKRYKKSPNSKYFKEPRTVWWLSPPLYKSGKAVAGRGGCLWRP